MDTKQYHLVQSIIVRFDNARQSLRAIEVEMSSIEDHVTKTLLALFNPGSGSSASDPDTR